ncbi:MAG: TipAS antibiotic-recognition domain-containing protein, partial [Elusimicrobiota bacterium]
MVNKTKFQPFDMTEIEKHQEQYAEEVKQKYGNSDAYKESQKRTAKYSKQDWQRIMSRGGEIFQTVAGLMDTPPESPEVQKVVGEWKQHITDSFYKCTLEIFRGLGDLYVADPRFTKNIDKIKPGLS